VSSRMTGRTGGEPVPILPIEDDPGDAALISEAFRQSPVPAELHVAANGEQAMRFLHQADEFTHAPRPALILLDLHLPGRPGPRPARRPESRPAPAGHPHRGAHWLPPQGRHPARLRTARQRLHHQAARLRRLHRRDRPDRHLLRQPHPVATLTAREEISGRCTSGQPEPPGRPRLMGPQWLQATGKTASTRTETHNRHNRRPCDAREAHRGVEILPKVIFGDDSRWA
jgi:CheY-like chemotaxis protein